ncbi:hypothetical protein DQ226_18580 [Dietzia maris]|uniref:Uncharacterized protein n=1 Tax=Dietzia maris TaxID=37915 RepID=A0A365P3J9_9ACTN|nr:hypothetical protein [Dietzia sp. UCD-THP]EYT50584.1 hypothetical protein H483_0118250 [Dietzia sp. UCD-THP]RBA29108.1 hypothetical protein DQ226_18580 [Dietzia maris]
MSTPEPLRAATVVELTHAVVMAALDGDRRARRVSIGHRAGIVTPHTDPDGDLDADDLAAQVWALANNLAADDGTYAEGIFTSGGRTYTVPYVPTLG